MISNQELKFIRSLHQKKYRDEHNMYLAEGVKIVKEAIINQPDKIDRIVYTPDTIEHLRQLSPPKEIWTIEASQTEIERMSSLKTPQGILAVMKIPETITPDIDKLSDLTIMLDQISDPGNLGTITRLANWFGIQHIICSPDTVEAYNPKVVQASMGAIFRTTISYVVLPDFLNKCRGKGNLRIYGTTLEGQNLYDTKLHIPAVILFGNEAKGLSKELIELTDGNLRIPDFNKAAEKTESLNVSIAAAIICSEFRRQLG